MDARFLLLLLLLPYTGEATDPSLNDDLLGLIVFKAVLIDPQSRLSSWNEDDEDPCKWAGIKCDWKTRRVAELSLDGFGISGKIDRGLLQLRSLRRLSLSRNNFSGSLNPDLTRLENLHTIDLSDNVLSGPIPGEFFWQCRSIRSVSLAGNHFSGEIPSSVGNCTTLTSLNLSSNWILGSLPTGLWSLNGLRMLDLSRNFLVGEIPSGMNQLFNLRTMNLRCNRLSGHLPDDIGGSSLLRSLDLGANSFSGFLPETMQRFTMCNYLNLESNNFSGEIPAWLGQLKNLQTLDLSNNQFTGRVPDSIGDLQFLKGLNVSSNRLTGSLPKSMTNCKGLVEVDFSRNFLAGSLPSWVFAMDMQKIILSGNNLYGPIEVSTSLQHTIQVLDLSANEISGMIPVEIGGLFSLQILNLSQNLFINSIPSIFGKLKLLETFDLSSNMLNDSIPQDIGEAVSLKHLKLDKNFLSGNIPIQIGNCSSLTSLVLSENNLSGQIPSSLAKIASLEIIDLSHNNLTGKLPKQLLELPHLLYLNISNNLFSGEIPSADLFNRIPSSSLSNNPDLCGSILNRSCGTVLPKPIVLNPNSSSSNSSPNSAFSQASLRHKKIILSISALIAIGAAVSITLGVITVTLLNLRVRAAASNSADALNVSDGGYYSRSPATDANSGSLVMFSGDDPEFSTGAHAILNKHCELGRGGFGTVYKTILRDGRPVAIKKLTISSLVKSRKDFEREIKKIGKTKHPNLVGLEGYYWTQSLQLLIYEFVSGESLSKHLHDSPEVNCLSWQERFNIILGVARSLAHLHRHDVIHYNLKSCNVLIDSSGQPKVADYGLAKLLPMLDRYVLSSKIQSSLGYMAPEFACQTVRITEKCDVYGFGVLVLEIITGRKPVEYMEDDVVVLCDVVRGALDEGRVEECLDERLGGKFPVEEAMPIVKLGLICTSQVPSNRPEMTEVVKILELIRCPQDGQEGESC